MGRCPETSTRQTLRHIYTAEIGVREFTGHNDGARVQEYLQYVNLRGNFSYCGAFVCWNLGKAGINNPKNGWAPALFPANRVIWTRNTATDRGVIKIGDVFGIYFSELKRIGHCGFVDQWDGTWCITVEGNTSNPIRAGPSAQGVYKKKRLIKTIYQVADWITTKK
ncbi:hypothetical protein SAMN05216436_107140 [bacterium A37T11]|nr:hypothetical protein SAMN05216436_107140 [bacterium A37T11]